MSKGELAANAALIIWALLSLTLFFTTRLQRAAFVTVFGAVMFLPELCWFKIPYFPPLGKEAIATLSVLLGCALRSPRRIWRLPRERWVTWLTLGMIVGGIGTWLTNTDVLVYGTVRREVLPALGFKDGMAVAAGHVLEMAVPFFLGGAIVETWEDLEDLLAFLAAAGVVYSLFAIIEMRMSPQLHLWVYGYHQHPDFTQTYRFGGYRPMVFMAHGLAVALFFVVTLVAATAVIPLRRRIWGVSARWVARYLAVILVLCRSAGTIVYGLLAAPLAAFASSRWLRRVATGVAAVVLLYPVLRQADLFPTSAVLSVAELAGPDRRASVQFRFDNEDLLVKKARERALFGWGEYHRNEIFDDAGHVTSVTDGAWIISLGTSGIVGFLTSFGLLVFPIWLSGRRGRLLEEESDRKLLATLALIVALTAFDLLPNGLFSNYPYFLAGALLSVSRLPSRQSWPRYA